MTTNTATMKEELARDDFVIRDVHCALCAATLEKAVAQIEGVVHAAVDPVLGRTRLDYDRSIVSEDELEDAVEAAGYEIIRVWS
jgi:copper chaperone CopZ